MHITNKVSWGVPTIQQGRIHGHKLLLEKKEKWKHDRQTNRQSNRRKDTPSYGCFVATKNGLHVRRRSEKQWVRLSSNLLIEQGLMRSLKISGALTIDKGIDESQRTIWSLLMPPCVSNLVQITPCRNLAESSKKQESKTRTCQKQGKVVTWKILQQ